MNEFLAWIILISHVAGIFMVYNIAKEKNRDAASWAFSCFIFTSFIVLILLLLVEPIKNNRNSKETSTSKPNPTKGNIENKWESENQHLRNEYSLSKWLTDMTDYFESFDSLNDLLHIKTPSEINYGDLLMTREWKFKRFKILYNDNFKCRDCGIKRLTNHVHHKYYLKNMLPWDIEDDALETLCYDCHKYRHLNKIIPVYELTGSHKNLVPTENIFCDRCGNTGYLPHFSHIENGICFKCHGGHLHNSVFYDILNKAYRNSTSNDYDLQESYENFLHDISYLDFMEKIPNAKDYSTKNNNSKSNNIERMEYDNDLPF